MLPFGFMQNRPTMTADEFVQFMRLVAVSPQPELLIIALRNIEPPEKLVSCRVSVI